MLYYGFYFGKIRSGAEEIHSKQFCEQTQAT